MFRTPDRVLARWQRELGLTRVAPDDLAPYYDHVEADTHVQPVKPHLWGKNSEVIRRGAGALGLSHGPLRRNVSDHCKGSGVCCFGCPEDGKQPMHLTYVPRADAAGARIYTRVKVTGVEVEAGRAVGVVGHAAAGITGAAARQVRVRVRARAVVIACGAVYTPAFLLANRLANGSGEVGKNLTIHPASRVAAVFDEDIDGWRGVPQGYMVDEFKDEGIMLEGAQGPPDLIGPGLPFVGPEFKKLVSDLRRVAIFGVMVSDTSHGRVWNVAGRPVMTYQLNRQDTERMVKGIGVLARIYFAAGAKRVLPSVYRFTELGGESDVEALTRSPVRASDVELMAFHPLGTCRMGADPRRSVVDAELRAHDLRDLWIVDGSVFPTSLGVNPQETIMAFSLRAADRLADQLGG
jgi:choline dehydrogenase-like flavoprotein